MLQGERREVSAAKNDGFDAGVDFAHRLFTSSVHCLPGKVLTPREAEVLAMVREGHTNKEIAWRLNICVRTVKFHTNSMLRKFGVRHRMELATAGRI